MTEGTEKIRELKLKCNRLLDELEYSEDERKKLLEQLEKWKNETIVPGGAGTGEEELPESENEKREPGVKKMPEPLNGFLSFTSALESVVTDSIKQGVFIEYRHASKNSGQYCKIEKEIFEAFAAQHT